MDPELVQDEAKQSSKLQVVRGARACTVCRAAKMKCVGAEDGQKQCQRCKRANVECIFEKHRRGRKPGSKLSEASKMLRRLEKGLNTAKLKSQSTDTSSYSASDPRGTPQDLSTGMLRPVDHYGSPDNHFRSNQLPPLNLPYQTSADYAASSNRSRSVELDDDEEDCDRTDEGLFPAKLIRKENQRHSFFRTILNPEHEAPSTPCHSNRGTSFPPPQPRAAAVPNGLNDPISAGIVDEEEAKILFDAIFLRLNPFINLFDPSLHTVPYVRSKCPFLFTTLIMAGCKFFKPEMFKRCQPLANEFAIRAFAEGWKRIEVVQAFACLTYWKDPDDNRTWAFIGYACRMAIELGLNRFTPKPPAQETDFQMRERRNRERTYLVLFVHDRSLSMQTGRNWMLPEDDLVKHSMTWHEEGGSPTRPEDVILGAFVQLRRIAAETTDMFYPTKGTSVLSHNHNDMNYEVVLRSCNGKLTQWAETWQREMQRAGGETFHFAFLTFFRLYVKLFLNSFGIQACMSPTTRTSPSLQAMSACYTCAVDTLRIVSKDFASMSMLRYSQDSVTVMTAYSAIILLKLLRSSNNFAQLHEGTAQEIHGLISQAADAYYDASVLSPASTSAAYHARFLRALVANDVFKSRRPEKERYPGMPIDPRLQGKDSSPASRLSLKSFVSFGATDSHSSTMPSSHPQSPSQMYSQQIVEANDQSFQFPTSAQHESDFPVERPANFPQSYAYPTPPFQSAADATYWRNMFMELGFGDNTDSAPGTGNDNMPSYHDSQNHHMNHPSLPYHHMHPSQAGYNH